MPLSRRTFLQGTVAGGVALAWTAGGVWARPARAAEPAVRVYQIVVDGLRVDEVDRMPTLRRLSQEGTYYPDARALMVAETTTNHLSMLTGLRPDRHGMPGNSVPRLSVRVSDNRRYTRADSILTLARRQAPELRTAVIGAKTYVAELAKHDRTGDGEQDATRTNTPVTAIPVVDSALDAETGGEALRISRELDPDLLFLNLGEVDRVGHVDETGGLDERGLPLLRQYALQNADLQLGNLVAELERSDRWERSVLIVTADHSMDWSRRDAGRNLAPIIEADALLSGQIVAAVNGGACLYALRSPDDPRSGQRLRRLREIALATDGIEEALYLHPNSTDGGERHWVGRVHPAWRLGELGGDLIVTCEPGFRIGHSASAPAVFANPIPGNHGHPVTLPIPLVVAGGYSGIVRQVVGEPGAGPVAAEDLRQATNLDLAPTAAWLLGLQPPPGGFDGRVLAEAFWARPSPRATVRNVASVPSVSRLGGDDDVTTAVELSKRLAPAGSAEVVLVAADDLLSATVAAPLAIAHRGPLLLTPAGALPGPVADELARLQPDRVIAVGSAIDDAVLQSVRDLGADVQRLAGDEPAGTAAAVARYLGVNEDDGRVVLVPATPAVGAMVTGVLAGANHPADPTEAGQGRGNVGLFGPRPILLSEATQVPNATRAALRDLAIARVTVAAGAEEVAPAVLSALRGLVDVVERLGGDDAAGGTNDSRSAVRVADRAALEGAFTDELYLVPTAAHTALGPAVAVLAGVHGGSVLPVDTDALAPGAPVRSWLEQRADELVRVTAVAGPAGLSAALLEDVARLLLRRRTRQAPDEPALRGGTRRSDPAQGTAGEVAGPTGSAAGPDGAPLPATGGGLASVLGGAAVLGSLALRRRGGAAPQADPAP